MSGASFSPSDAAQPRTVQEPRRSVSQPKLDGPMECSQAYGDDASAATHNTFLLASGPPFDIDGVDLSASEPGLAVHHLQDMSQDHSMGHERDGAEQDCPVRRGVSDVVSNHGVDRSLAGAGAEQACGPAFADPHASSAQPEVAHAPTHYPVSTQPSSPGVGRGVEAVEHGRKADLTGAGALHGETCGAVRGHTRMRLSPLAPIAPLALDQQPAGQKSDVSDTLCSTDALLQDAMRLALQHDTGAVAADLDASEPLACDGEATTASNATLRDLYQRAFTWNQTDAHAGADPFRAGASEWAAALPSRYGVAREAAGLVGGGHSDAAAWQHAAAAASCLPGTMLQTGPAWDQEPMWLPTSSAGRPVPHFPPSSHDVSPAAGAAAYQGDQVCAPARTRELSDTGALPCSAYDGGLGVRLAPPRRGSWAGAPSSSVPRSSSPGPSEPDAVPGGHGSTARAHKGSVARPSSEHPLGEYPSRTLFVRNINIHTTDEELRELFARYGVTRSMYSACKHRGFVMISYYDIRAATRAKQLLQGFVLRQRAIDVHFSVPKENAAEPDLNQGTLVVFNMDPGVSKADVRRLFESFGEVKEIRATPRKDGHKFVEFFDSRDAHAALQALNRAIIGGRQLKIELSRPGGVRRARQHGTGGNDAYQVLALSSGVAGPHAAGVTAPPPPPPPPPLLPQTMVDGTQHGPLPSAADAFGAGMGDLEAYPEDAFQSIMQQSALVAPAGSVATHTSQTPECGLPRHAPGDVSRPDRNFGGVGVGWQDVGSVPSVLSQLDISSKLAVQPQHDSASSFGPAYRSLLGSASAGDSSGITPGMQTPVHRVSEHGAMPTSKDASDDFSTGPAPGCKGQDESEMAASMAAAAASLAAALAKDVTIPQEEHETRLHQHLLEQLRKMHQHARGQAVMDRLIASGASMDALVPDESALYADVAAHASASRAPASEAIPIDRVATLRRVHECTTPGTASAASSLQLGTPGSLTREALHDGEGAAVTGVRPQAQAERRRGSVTGDQFVLSREALEDGSETRTTLMIRNIPNKYSQKVLMQTIDAAGFFGKYDFFYLPIDFRNRCNVGYAFINMASTQDVLRLHDEFHNKGWERFNSEKRCCVAFARIQTRRALVAHFQNSSLMNEDKRCRPVLLNLEGREPEVEPFPAPKRSGHGASARGSALGRGAGRAGRESIEAQRGRR